MLEEWAYARPYTSEAERAACFTDWLHTYNHHRGHTALNGKSPADLVPNLRGQNNSSPHSTPRPCRSQLAEHAGPSGCGDAGHTQPRRQRVCWWRTCARSRRGSDRGTNRVARQARFLRQRAPRLCPSCRGGGGAQGCCSSADRCGPGPGWLPAGAAIGRTTASHAGRGRPARRPRTCPVAARVAMSGNCAVRSLPCLDQNHTGFHAELMAAGTKSTRTGTRTSVNERRRHV